MLRLATGRLVVIALSAGAAGAQAVRLSAADRSFVDRTVMRAMVNDRLPGVSIAISDRGLATNGPMACGT